MWFRFKGFGRHYHDGNWYKPSERVYSEYRLDLIFPNILFLASEVYIPRPKRIGQRILLQQEKRGEEMKTYVQVRQNLLSVPENQGITKQHVTVLEGDTVVLDGFYALSPAPEEMPTYWAEVGANVSVLVRYADDDGHESEPFRDDYVQDGIPVPTPTPEPEPVPTPEPIPEPVVLSAPTGVGVRELLSQVESDTRPVQARRRRSTQRRK